jgi:hypothetical protein
MTTPSPTPAPTSVRPIGARLLLTAVAAACAGALLILSFGYADHAPRPHGVTVAVVGPSAAVPRTAAGLAHALPGGFTVVRSPSAGAARAALRAQRIRGALVLGPGQRAPVLVAGAAGLSLSQVVGTALSAAASAARRHPVITDIVPLPSHDRSGLDTFVLELGLLIPSVIGSVGLYLVGLRSRLWWRVGAGSLFAVLVAGLGVLVMTQVFGALGGAWLATLGIAALGALAFVLAVGAAQATLGLPATGLMALVLVFVGNATSGGSVPTGMLPAVYREISPWLPNGAIVHGVRAVTYFGGHGLGQPLLALALWAGGGVVVLLLNDALHLGARRRRPDALVEIYATPGIVHAARLARRRPTEAGGGA